MNPRHYMIHYPSEIIAVIRHQPAWHSICFNHSDARMEKTELRKRNGVCVRA